MPKTKVTILRRALAKLAQGKDATREVLAFHESAHAVIAWVQGVDVSRVTIDAEEAAAERDDLAAATTRAGGTWVENARISVAGRIADQEIEDAGITQILDVGPGGHNDEQDTNTCLLYEADMTTDPARLVSALEHLWAETELNLEQLQQERHAVAEELCRRGAMGSEDLARVLGPLPAVNEVTLAQRAEVRAEVEAGHPRLKEWKPRRAKG